MGRLVMMAVALAGCDGCNRALPIDEPSGDVVQDLAVDLSRDLAVAGDLASQCDGLSEAACRAHKACVADYCVECSCIPTFVGCRAPSAAKMTCPGLGCDQPTCCTSPADCNPNGRYDQECVAPGQWAGCGICFMEGPLCESDSDCPADGGTNLYNGPVCDDPTVYRLCGPCLGGKICLPGCSDDSECVGGRVCDASHHCVLKPCANSGECGGNFDCSGGACSRKSCIGDADCPAGFCVDNFCFEGYGTCEPVPA